MRRAIINGILSGVISGLLVANKVTPFTPAFWLIMLSVWTMMTNSIL